MAILDKALIFFNNEVIDSESIANIDLGAGGDAIGQELTLTIVANEAISGDPMQFVLGTLDAPAATLDDVGTYESKGALVVSPLNSAKPAGAIIFQCRVPKGAKRYLYLVEYNGSGSSGKKITAYLSKEL